RPRRGANAAAVGACRGGPRARGGRRRGGEEAVNAWPHDRRGGGFLAIAVARAERWLLEPPPPRPRAADPAPEVRPVVAVVGLAPRCGATTIARALAVELAQRDRSGAALASARARGPAPALATAAARRLARGLPREVATA